MNHSNNTDLNRHYHFIGIGGIGMSALAIFYLQQGFKVSGSDIVCSEITDQLAQLGAKIFIGHNQGNIVGADYIIYSSAVPKTNPEYIAAQANRKTLLKRGMLLSKIASDYAKTIAVTGTHGKTTVAALLTHVLTVAKRKPNYIIGGISHSLNLHAHRDHSEYMVIEADESDASFLYTKPQHIIITNVNQDHMQTYDHSQQRLLKSFYEFARQSHQGELCIGVDYPGGLMLTKMLPQGFLSYGFSDNATVKICNYIQNGKIAYFDLKLTDRMLNGFQFNLPGKHNIENAAAVIALALKIGIDEHTIKQALASFKGVKRRFDCYQSYFQDKKITIVDDYGHHPVEIQRTLEAIAKRFPNRRLIHLFQPHRYTRTRDLFNELLQALLGADLLILADVYSAGEPTIKGATSYALHHQLQSMRSHCYYVKNFDNAEAILKEFTKDNDVILIQGAGNIAELSDKFRTECVKANTLKNW